MVLRTKDECQTKNATTHCVKSVECKFILQFLEFRLHVHIAIKQAKRIEGAEGIWILFRNEKTKKKTIQTNRERERKRERTRHS